MVNLTDNCDHTFPWRELTYSTTEIWMRRKQTYREIIFCDETHSRQVGKSNAWCVRRMGAWWSSNGASDCPLVSDSLHFSKRQRIVPTGRLDRQENELPSSKRRRTELSETVDEKEHNAAEQQPSCRNDGPQRFKVRCPSLYWSNKKDVVRILKRIPDFPLYTSLQKLTSQECFYISFSSSSAAETGVRLLSDFVHRGDNWTIKKVPERVEPPQQETETPLNLSRGSSHAGAQTCKTAADVTAPWRFVEYDVQVKRKRDMMVSALALVTREMQKGGFPDDVVPWLKLLTDRNDLPVHDSTVACCPLVQFIEANSGVDGGRDFYRNKNEFTVGYSPSSCGMKHTHHVREPTVGFALGLVRDGEVHISKVTEDCRTTSVIAQQIASALNTVVKESGLEPYDKRTHRGYWRQIMVRHSERRKRLLVVAMVCTTDFQPATTGIWDDSQCRERVKLALDNALLGTSYKWGLYWQVNNHVSAPAVDVPVDWVCGERDVFENLLGLTFRVSPLSFFQVNTVMAERLYSVIGELGNLNRDCVLLDICCGTGTIGLCLANRVHRVVGVEMCEPAVKDARHNASRNSIDNALFLVGKVEDRIREALSFVKQGRECVAVLDPPRAGVHSKVCFLSTTSTKFICGCRLYRFFVETLC